MKLSCLSDVSVRVTLALCLFMGSTMAFRTFSRLRYRALSREAVASDTDLESLIEYTKKATSNQEPFSERELDSAVASIKVLAGTKSDGFDWRSLRSKFAECAHLSHKNWKRTSHFAKDLMLLLKGPSDEIFCQIFKRVLEDGNWYGACDGVKLRKQKPWAVLVTGLNGIRKTSCIYQPWFEEALREALVREGLDDPKTEILPAGHNSYFRQLDFLVSTMANNAFHDLYDSAVIKSNDVLTYARLKDALFARYRTLAEIVGILLVEEAKKRQLNVIVETSGRDIAMYQYIDHCFDKDRYNKLVVHFTINDRAFAESSVDARMRNEMKAGRQALVKLKESAVSGSKNSPNEVLRLHQALVGANEGGPYGSAQLASVQKASDDVWNRISQPSLTNEDDYARKINRKENWYRAKIMITANVAAPWTAEADNGKKSTVFEFERR